MSMYLSDMQQEIRDAEETLRNADKAANSLARSLVGRLRHCDSWVLADLKKELRGFNAHTAAWKP